MYNYEAAAGPTAVVVKRNTITGADEGIVEDQGYSNVTDNSVTGGNIGIWIPQYSGQTATPELAASHDVLTGNSVAAVQVESDGAAGDEPVVASVTKSDLSGAPFGIENNSSSVVSATLDYWGATTGPSGQGIGSGDAVDVNVSFFPWDRAVSDNLDVATPSTPAMCTKTGTSISSTTANAVLCVPSASESANISYAGTGPVLIIGAGSDDITLGSSGHAVGGVSLILNGGSSDVLANSSTGGYQLWNGATVTLIGGSHLPEATSPLVTG